MFSFKSIDQLKLNTLDKKFMFSYRIRNLKMSLPSRQFSRTLAPPPPLLTAWPRLHRT